MNAVIDQSNTASGAEIARWFAGSGTVEAISPISKSEDGWKQYPTHQDSAFFRVKVNPLLKEVLTFCKQNVSYIICRTDAQWQLELKDLATFYGRHSEPDIASQRNGLITKVAYQCYTFMPDPAVTVAFFMSGVTDYDDLSRCKRPQMLHLSSAAIDRALSDPRLCQGFHWMEPKFLTLQEGTEYQLNLLDERSFDHGLSVKLIAIDKMNLRVRLDRHGQAGELREVLLQDVALDPK